MLIARDLLREPLPFNFIVFALSFRMCSTKTPCSGVIQNIKNGHCYRRFCDHKTFKEAKETCSDLGGYLPTVRNSYEDKFLATLAKAEPQSEQWGYPRCHWIGLKLNRNSLKPDKFEWSNGEENWYRNWHPGRPDDWYGEECVHYSFESGFWDQWNDLDCNKKLQYFCEWDSCKKALSKI
ncbi:unnamed protein product [Cylicocyclus nassatus]|uniref:C-type lectin domain-containing protein n=1 Tax=Cylicocyclus nassatus TaxID=53992 RepID=A0AA36GLV4_CYLNA|nr:unnamed protein product [Cylicocyclus nassatus]